VTTLTQRFFTQALRYENKLCFAHRSELGWESQTWSQVAHQVRNAMTGLVQAGIEPGDRIVLLAENRPEWAIFDLAIMGIGALVVPAYVTHTERDLRHICDLVEPKGIIVSSEALTRKVMLAVRESQTLKRIWSHARDAISTERDKQPLVENWDSLLSDQPNKHAELHPCKDSDTCCLIFTSGTSGLPKAAMLSHKSIGANVDAAIDILSKHNFGSHDRFLSFLPLAHAYEHTAGLHMPIALGAEIWFCESTEKLQQYLPEVCPTVATAVPRLYDMLYGRINSQLKNASNVKQLLFTKTLELGKKRSKGEKFSIFESLTDRGLDQLVRKKVRARFGGRIRYFISGGAALNPAVGEFFTALGVGIIQGYGQTEASPLISVNRPGKIQMDSVGQAFDGVDTKIADDGELLVKGDLVMNGYWQDPKATDGTIIDGWLHTGDLATIDENGFIKITGRKKDLIVTSGGDNISPSKIESLLCSEAEIEQAVVCGDGKPWLCAVIVPTADLAPDSQIYNVVESAIQRINSTLAPAERIRKFIIQKDLCTTENGLLTPTQKVKRTAVIELNGKQIERLYG